MERKILGRDYLLTDGSKYVYTNFEMIGYGGSCIAYKADRSDWRDKSITVKVIIKELYPYKENDDPNNPYTKREDNGSLTISPEYEQYFNDYKQRFLDGQNKHIIQFNNDPNSVTTPMFEMIEANNTVYAVSLPSEGLVLSEVYENNNRLTLDEIAKVMMQICDRIGSLHKQGYLHLDIKPENFFYTGKKREIDKHIQMFDFDTVTPKNKLRTWSEWGSYSPSYAPEEQRECKLSSIGYHTDIYAMGGVFFFLLTGKTLGKKDLEDIRKRKYSWESNKGVLETCSPEVIDVIEDLEEKMLGDIKSRRKSFKTQYSCSLLHEAFRLLYGRTAGGDNYRPIYDEIKVLMELCSESEEKILDSIEKLIKDNKDKHQELVEILDKIHTDILKQLDEQKEYIKEIVSNGVNEVLEDNNKKNEIIINQLDMLVGMISHENEKKHELPEVMPNNEAHVIKLEDGCEILFPSDKNESLTSDNDLNKDDFTPASPISIPSSLEPVPVANPSNQKEKTPSWIRWVEDKCDIHFVNADDNDALITSEYELFDRLRPIWRRILAICLQFVLLFLLDNPVLTEDIGLQLSHLYELYAGVIAGEGVCIALYDDNFRNKKLSVNGLIRILIFLTLVGLTIYGSYVRDGNPDATVVSLLSTIKILRLPIITAIVFDLISISEYKTKDRKLFTILVFIIITSVFLIILNIYSHFSDYKAVFSSFLDTELYSESTTSESVEGENPDLQDNEDSLSLQSNEEILQAPLTISVAPEVGDEWYESINASNGELVKCLVEITNIKEFTSEKNKLECYLTNNISFYEDNGIVFYSESYPDGIMLESEFSDLNSFSFLLPNMIKGEKSWFQFFIMPSIEEGTHEEAITAKLTLNGESYQTSKAITVSAINGGWGDNLNGRREFTWDEVINGGLAELITFNSISDGAIGHEFNFVGAKYVDSENPNGLWSADSIQVKDGDRIKIRAYYHNNNQLGIEYAAKDVKVRFSFSKLYHRHLNIIAYIESSNAVPSLYWDSVSLICDNYFYVEYIDGSARLTNSGIGKDGGIALPNDVITDGTLIGQNALDGIVPGGIEYDGEVTIELLIHEYSR